MYKINVGRFRKKLYPFFFVHFAQNPQWEVGPIPILMLPTLWVMDITGLGPDSQSSVKVIFEIKSIFANVMMILYEQPSGTKTIFN